MELFHWILICSFMIFISYSPIASVFNSCERDAKLSILVTKMDEDLATFSIHTLVRTSSSSSSSPSKLALGTGLFSWYLFTFGCLWDVDISRLFRFLFFPWDVLICLLCIAWDLFCGASVLRTIHETLFSYRSVQWKRSFFGISIALKQALLFHRLLESSLVKLLLSLYVNLYFIMSNGIQLCISCASPAICLFLDP